MKNITIVGSGFVGLSNGILLAQHNNVKLFDIDKNKIDMINSKISPIEDKEISEYLLKDINLIGTTDKEYAYNEADFIVIAVPTDYNQETNYFNTTIVEYVLQDIKKYNNNCTIVIKSTIPIGYVKSVREKFNMDNIIFSPEFLREGMALYDNLYPSRIIVGEKSNRAEEFANLLKEGAIKKDIPILYTNSTEAEAVKLFSNGYLAMRVSYFNEVDTYCEQYGLSSKDIIIGMGYDERIGNYYNNPSFGYGGYCFPKDTKQLKANYDNTPNSIISAIVESNEKRKEFIVDQIMKKSPKVVGIYRLIMKSGSDNFRSSAISDIINKLKEKNVGIIIYEPVIESNNFEGICVEKKLDKFKELSDIIIANRLEENIKDSIDKVYTRDIFSSDI